MASQVPSQIHTVDDLESLVGEGTRCRVCSRVWTTQSSAPNNYCREHDEYNQSVEALMGRVCVALQDSFAELPQVCRLMTARRGDLTPHRRLSQDERWLWDRVLGFRALCQTSQMVLHDVLGSLFSQDVFDISEIKEITFSPGQDLSNHSVFLLRRRNQVVFIFDPTGVQFGPDWPVLCRFDEYRDRIKSEIKAFPLGDASRKLAGSSTEADIPPLTARQVLDHIRNL
ncbi:hypothetical protein CC80DRAFT_169239 [Byssothecium circinans]|uniref:Uncharacterized protein n=1 Tax=Byssothecium circinans TaxID=147558 RepID=A0A6A5TKM3_9PLEO|nr:hypothetical protein CC80DRAFT_169239 [Byssothecium circinans]